MHRIKKQPPKPITITGSKQFDECGVIPITVKRTGDIQELRDRYGYNLPKVRNFEGERQRTHTYPRTNFWHNYGTSLPVVRLLFSGRLPLNFFNDICYGRKVHTPPVIPRYGPTIHREKELWEPKKDVKPECRRKVISVNEARTRHRKRLEQIREKAQEHHKQVEAVLIRQGEIERRGLTCYLKKMERETERLMQKWKKSPPSRSRDSAIPLVESGAETDVFITKSGRRMHRRTCESYDSDC